MSYEASRQPSIETQQLLLAEIQRQDAETLEKKGIKDLVFDKFDTDDYATLEAGNKLHLPTAEFFYKNPNTKVGVSIDMQRLSGGVLLKFLNVKFEAPQEHGNDQTLYRSRTASVAECFGGVRMSTANFQEHHALLVHNMLECLALEQAYGRLPNLDNKRFAIFNPNKAMIDIPSRASEHSDGQQLPPQ